MARFELPAHCTTCGTVYGSGYFLDTNLRANIRLSGNRVQCPNGHLGVLPDASYVLMDGVIRLASGQSGDPKALSNIQDIIREVTERKRDPKSAVYDISNELSVEPDAADAVRALGQQNPISAIWLLLQILAVVVGIPASILTSYSILFSSNSPPSHHVTINNTVNITVNDEINSASDQATEPRDESIVPRAERRRQQRAIRKLKEQEEKRQTKSQKPAK